MRHICLSDLITIRELPSFVTLSFPHFNIPWSRVLRNYPDTLSLFTLQSISKSNGRWWSSSFYNKEIELNEAFFFITPQLGLMFSGRRVTWNCPGQGIPCIIFDILKKYKLTVNNRALCIYWKAIADLAHWLPSYNRLQSTQSCTKYGLGGAGESRGLQAGFVTL